VPFASPPVSAPATGTLTRRRFLGATGLGVVLTVPACAERPGSAPAPKASRTFDGAFGPVEAPVAPQRVASTDFYTAYALLDVGFTVAPDNSAGDMRRPVRVHLAMKVWAPRTDWPHRRRGSCGLNMATPRRSDVPAHGRINWRAQEPVGAENRVTALDQRLRCQPTSQSRPAGRPAGSPPLALRLAYLMLARVLS
jgi:hypothetical protein